MTVGDQIYWLAISGVNVNGRPIYRNWLSGTILSIESNGAYLVRRTLGGTCIVDAATLARTSDD